MEAASRAALIHVKRRDRFHKQQSRRRYAANGFAFVPQTCRAPNTARRGCRTDTEGLTYNRQPDQRSIMLAR